MADKIEIAAYTPEPIDPAGFNPRAKIPYGCTTEHIQHVMEDFIAFLGFINTQLLSKDLAAIEAMLMPANFSSMVGEFMSVTIPKYCTTLSKNRYHNGHPDLIPSGKYPGDAVQYCSEGIEIKASRYLQGWQGHNPEDCWLMVFVFEASRATDVAKKVTHIPFKFLTVVGARLSKKDWLFAGRSAKSRRTITASVKPSGHKKMMENWIYKALPLHGKS